MANTQQHKYWTYDDLFGLPDDGKRYEIIEGVLYELPAPSPEHAIIIANVMFWPSPLIRALGGRILTAPLDLFLGDASPVQPDVFVLLAGQLAQISERGVEGPPSLVVEVLSPSNPEHVRITKRALYARSGIPEYWLINPRALTVEVLALQGGLYRTHILAGGDAIVTSTILAEIRFPARVVFE